MAIIKLNGGLGTGMGLQKAKSLLEVRDGLNFLDLTAKQILTLRERSGLPLRFLLMNSFSTSDDTLEHLAKYPELGETASLEFVQSMAPKLDTTSLEPVSWPQNPSMEWCPPGHGDLPSILSSGQLDQLLESGVCYAFVSNSDNLGATLDLDLFNYFAETNTPFLMEVTRRTEADKKGGHLAQHAVTGQLLLRESAQCSEEDKDAFQDITRHLFFNTNNVDQPPGPKNGPGRTEDFSLSPSFAPQRPLTRVTKYLPRYPNGNGDGCGHLLLPGRRRGSAKNPFRPGKDH